LGVCPPRLNRGVMRSTDVMTGEHKSTLTFHYGKRALVHLVAWWAYLFAVAAFIIGLDIRYERRAGAGFMFSLLMVTLLVVFGAPHAIRLTARLRHEPTSLSLDETSLRVVWNDREQTFALRDVRVEVALGRSFMDALILRRALEFRVADVSFIIFSFIGGYDVLCKTLQERGLLEGKHAA